MQKFDKLRQTQRGPSVESSKSNLRSSWVVNLTDRNLTAAEESVLSKGPKFATAPRLKTIDVAAPIEAALQMSGASDQVKETARIKICEAVRRAKKPTSNLTDEERKAYGELKEDKTVQILHADKGNATVVMTTSDYHAKIHELIDDKESYLVLEKDPTRATERELLSLLRRLRKDGKMEDGVYDQVRPSEGSSKCALFYGRVKLHKPTIPLRPVVATCGTSTYALARYIASILRPLVATEERILRNTADLVDVMKDVVVNNDEVIVSFDVKSLFTSIPVEESIKICEQRLNSDPSMKERTDLDVETIVRLLRFCLSSTSFRYQGTFYKQLDGVAMGSPVSPIIADIFMVDLEEKAFATFQSVAPRIWFRFVDDVISVVKKETAEPFLNHLNNQHKRIKFTMEMENEGKLPFMDVGFIKQEQGELLREVYQKPTHTNRYVQFDSHHSASVKSGVIASLTNRAITVCSNQSILDAEFDRIRKIMRGNGYPRRFIDRAISSQVKRRTTMRAKQEAEDQHSLVTTSIPFVDGVSQEIRRIARTAGVRCAFFTPCTMLGLYSAKDQLHNDTRTHAVYSVKCKTCEGEYIGETLRAIGVRQKEHRDAIRLGHVTKSAIAEHVHNQVQAHEIDWSTFDIIDQARQRRERKIREAMHIYQRKPQINRDDGVERSSTWNAII